MLDKKGFTIAEVIVSFSMLTILLASVVAATSFYRDKVKQEEIITQLTDFKNTITKVVYDDIIAQDGRKIVSASKCVNEPHCIDFIDKDGNIKVFKIEEINTLTENNEKGVYLSYDDTKYLLPDSDLGEGADRVCDFVGDFELKKTNENGVKAYTVDVQFAHKTLEKNYNIMLTIDSLPDNELPEAVIEGSLTSSSTSVLANNAVSVTATCTNPSNCNFTYQWYINDRNSTNGGTKIDGATSKYYTSNCSQVDKYLYAVATASADGYQNTEIVLSKTIEVRPELYVTSCQATLSGTPKVGNTVTVTNLSCGNSEMTSWTIDEYDFFTGYRWQGYYGVQWSTSNQYTIPSSDLGKIILAGIKFKNVVDAPGHCYGGTSYASSICYNTNPVTN